MSTSNRVGGVHGEVWIGGPRNEVEKVDQIKYDHSQNRSPLSLPSPPPSAPLSPCPFPSPSSSPHSQSGYSSSAQARGTSRFFRYPSPLSALPAGILLRVVLCRASDDFSELPAAALSTDADGEEDLGSEAGGGKKGRENGGDDGGSTAAAVEGGDLMSVL